MKKIILLLFLANIFSSSLFTNKNFELIQSSDNIKLEFSLDDIYFENVNGYTKISSSSMGETSLVGMPKLPTFSTMIMLKPTKEYTISYKVLSSYVLDEIQIIPNQKIINGLENKDIIELIQFESIYPNENISLSDPMIMRDLVVSSLKIIPFIYNQSLQQLEVIESIEVTITPIGDIPDPRSRITKKSKVFENIYKNTVLNYENNSRNNDYQQSSVLYIGSSSVINNATFQQLLQWRRERGYVVYTATTSETGSSSSAIKNYINDAYDDYDPAPEYVTLIGDVGGSYSLPTYYEDFGHDSYGNQCEGDHPFSQLDGNDLLPEVLIARMSLRSSSEIATVVYKILNYEKATYLDTYPNYYSKAAMAGDPSTSGNSCAITKEVIKESMENHGFSDVDIKTSGNGWSTWMQNELSDGVLYLNYRGYLGMSGFSTSDVDNASSGWKLPFATILTCGTGSFAEDQTSMSEKFFRAGSVTNPKGSVAAIGTATWNTHTLFNNIVDMGIYNGLLADDVETAGGALASGKLALYNTYPGDPYQWISAFTQWNNLMGDGATHLWTSKPEIFEPEHVSSIYLGSNFIDISVLDSRGFPVSNAMISILEDGANIADIYFSNSDGLITIPLNPISSNDLTLTITKQDFKPYQTTINISEPDVNVNYDNSQNLVIIDGNDGIPSAGETIEISIPLINFGSNNAENIQAVLTSTSENVTIENNTVSYGNILPNSSSYGQGNFLISLSGALVQYEDLGLRLNIPNGQFNQFQSEVPLEVSGSLLTVTSSHNVLPGQNSLLNIELSNLGLLDSDNITGELISNSSQIQVLDSNGNWNAILSGESLNSSNDFQILLSNDIVGGSQLILDLFLQNESGYSRTEKLLITAGNLSVDDPMGPDNYGYYIYDSGDNGFDLAPDYDWVEISSIGSNLNLSNSGDGNWSGNGPTTNINLPFDFKFYGQTYNQIGVCTNGWIALGGSDSEAFRNYPIPGAGGPSPMIAAFWDDLETGNSGEIYAYSTNEYVIIQWDNMRTHWGNDNNTFQVILYNNTAPPFSDNNIKIQYKDFNNTSSGSFTSYPPVHGSYATIGIENHLSNDGLQYTYYNNYPTSAMNLNDQTALYITTQAPISLPVPSLYYSINNSDLEVEIGSTASSEIVLSNLGEEGSLLNYSIAKSYPEVSSPFDVTGGGPDSYGYFWSDSDINNSIDFEWIDITEIGTLVSFGSNDASTNPIDIGFDFPFYDENYSSFIINANGWIGFEDDNDEWYNGNIPSQDAPRAAIFGFWDDLNPINDNCNSTCEGNVYYHYDSDRLIVSFNNVAHWFSEGFENSYYTFQIVVYSDGNVDINIDSIEGNYSATVGMQNQSGTIAIQVDEYNGNYFNNNMSINFERPYIPSDWLSIYSDLGLSGDLIAGESILFDLYADSENLEVGNYEANIIISSNAISDQVIPINLVVLDELGILGDINYDEAVNVSDVVLLVSIVVNNEYLQIGDLNEDNTIDVIDIVLLVNLILQD